MTGDTTSLALPNSARGEWRQWLAFLRRPQLPEQTAPVGRSARGMARMLGLDMMVMALLIGAIGTATALGLELPETALNNLEMNAGTIALLVIVAPLLEEIGFRSWLSGKPGHVLAIAIIGVSLLVSAMLAESQAGEAAQITVALLVIGGLLLAALVAFALRKRPPMGWFARLFPGFFWLSTIGFALIHLLNYTEGALAILLPLVLPQFVLGAILGYVRVHYGLWSAIALHMAHNGLIVGVVVTAAESAA